MVKYDDDDFVPIDGNVIAETTLAILIDTDDEVWIPRSQIDGGEDLQVGDAGPFEVTKWFAIKEGLV